MKIKYEKTITDYEKTITFLCDNDSTNSGMC